jgi:hypothetical protein
MHVNHQKPLKNAILSPFPQQSTLDEEGIYYMCVGSSTARQSAKSQSIILPGYMHLDKGEKCFSMSAHHDYYSIWFNLTAV